MNIYPHWEAYAGWVWNKFSADQSFAGPNVDFEETGYTFGLQLVRPLTSKINYLIRGGGFIITSRLRMTAVVR